MNIIPPHPYVRSNWLTGLMDDIQDTENLVMETYSIAVIKDKFPKSKHHYLVIPKRKIDYLSSLRREDVYLVKEMQILVKAICKR